MAWSLSPADLLAGRGPRDEAVVFLSSGTTGPPKTIVHTHQTLLSLTYNTYARYVELCTQQYE